MWQPNRAQWRVIWIVTLLMILAWPPAEGRSLGVKLANWLADPRHELPTLPDPLPMGLGDDGDAVAEHDAKMAEYHQVYDNSALARFRLRLRDAGEPFSSTTERQVLTGIGVLAALVVWRLAR